MLDLAFSSSIIMFVIRMMRMINVTRWLECQRKQVIHMNAGSTKMNEFCLVEKIFFSNLNYNLFSLSLSIFIFSFSPSNNEKKKIIIIIIKSEEKEFFVFISLSLSFFRSNFILWFHLFY